MGRPKETSKFTEKDQKQLVENPNVQRVTEKSVSYSPEFKVRAVHAYENGQTPAEIFLNAGFNLLIIGSKTPARCLNRWRKTYAAYGESGLLVERRGKNSTGRPSEKELSVEEQLKRAEARIQYLEAENDFLKKLEALERQNPNELTPSERFQIINHTIRRHQLRYMTRYLCQLAEVSTSGYYRWLKAEDYRQQRAYADEQDFLLIKEHFDALKQKAGALVIKMRLERMSGVIMNHKKIRRIMKQYHLFTKIRRVNPYRKMAKATQEHQTCPNLLKRQFDQGEPEKVLLTDITYLKYGKGQWAYLSCVKDGATKQILAHDLSTSLELPLVERTFSRLFERLAYIHPEAVLHSDQGMHYTHPTIQALIKKAGMKQSMSRKGNCWDNASMESFFGHMKDEMEYEDCQTLEELRARIEDYMEFYNTERFQWTLKKMTPDEYRSHLLIA